MALWWKILVADLVHICTSYYEMKQNIRTTINPAECAGVKISFKSYKSIFITYRNNARIPLCQIQWSSIDIFSFSFIISIILSQSRNSGKMKYYVTSLAALME